MKAAIFDLDGTLADTIEDLAGAVNRALSRRGFPVHGTEAYKLMVGNGFRNLVTKALPESERSEELVEALKAEAAADYEVRCLELTKPYPGIMELLSTLAGRGLPMAVLSNKIHSQTVTVVAGLFPGIAFALVRGESPEFPRKPDPTSALDVARILGAEPHDILYLGDSDVDMRTALAAGMLALGAGWGFRGAAELRESGAAAVLESPSEFLRFL